MTLTCRKKRVSDAEMGRFVKKLLRAAPCKKVVFFVNSAGYFCCHPAVTECPHCKGPWYTPFAIEDIVEGRA